jgi:predicted dehydrogenase
MAIIGAGNIAEKMSTTINGLQDVEAYAIAARDYDRAAAFAKKHGFTKAYGSYEEMLNDDNVNLVYIATPHSLHYQHAKLCLKHNKNVLCEKTFTVNTEQAEELFKMAESKGLLLTEAIWTRYMPSRKMIDDVIASGVIGTPTSLVANLGYNMSHIKRLITPKLAGGALLDLGVYLLHFASMVFGRDTDRIISTASMTVTGVDAADSITIVFRDGKMAVMHSSMLAALDRRAVIFGTKGYLDIQNLNNPEKLTVYNENYHEISVYYPPKQITGYEYEVLACKEAIKNGRLECEAIPHAETLRIMRMLDEIRAQWRYEIPTE